MTESKPWISVGKDGEDEPTLWFNRSGAEPQPIVRYCDLGSGGKYLWPILVYKLVGELG